MDNKKPLYMPIKTSDSEDFISGIGKIEIAIIAMISLISITLSIIVSIITTPIHGVFFCIIIIGTSILIIKRDISNENMIKKVFIIKQFIDTEKIYLYENYTYIKEE